MCPHLTLMASFVQAGFISYAAACVGTDSQLAGKAAGCEGCPNQEACATAPKGPDPGALQQALAYHIPVNFLEVM